MANSHKNSHTKKGRNKPVAQVYLDHASLTPIDPRVMKEMARVSGPEIANPSSVHSAGVRAKKELEAARFRCATFLHAHADEIVFTGSGTEANNIALLGAINAIKAARALLSKNVPHHSPQMPIHILVSAIEHTSVLETVRAAASSTVTDHADSSVTPAIIVDLIPVTAKGIVDLDALKKLITPETALISVMSVNNEIGTIQPINEIVKIAHGRILVHTDACQAALYTDLNMEKCRVDLLTLDSHKVYGPRGVGMLFIRRSVAISPIMFGGGQEKSLRPGTENIPGIVGFAKALEIAAVEREKETARLTKLREYGINLLVTHIPSVVIHGDREMRIANNINFSIPGIDHEYLMIELDAKGIACSTKSSCLRDEDESYVIRAITEKTITGKKSALSPTHSIRLSLGRATTKKDIDYLVNMIIMSVSYSSLLSWKISPNNKSSS